MDKIVLGIDLGTTCSSVSFIQPDGIKIIEDKINHSYRIPSIVHFRMKDNELKVDVGENAKDFLSIDPKNTIFDSKRMIGRQYDDPEIRKLIPSWPFNVEKKDDDGKILICLDGIDMKIEPYKVSGYILKYVASLGNDCLKPEQKTNKVVITVPANFCDAQRHETKLAAEFAGLEVLKLLNEPTAAGIDYGMSEKSDTIRYAVVFDFGGGTLDVSLLTVNNTDIKIIRTDGDMFLGGRNFDDNLVNYLQKKYKMKKALSKERTRPKRLKKLREIATKIKEKLSEMDETNEFLELSDDYEYEIQITLNEFEEINEELINKICHPIERLLESSNINKNKINDVLLVGGSSNMKFVKRKLEEFFNKEPFLHANSGTAVARGAAFVASQFAIGNDLFSSIAANKQFSYEDVSSYSIGIQTLGGCVSVIIPKGTALPALKSKSYHTILYRQESFDIDIFEGFSEKVEENFLLGSFSITNIPQSDHFVEFIVSLELDKDGILSASAKLIDNDIHSEKTIKLKIIKNQKLAINHQYISEDINEVHKKIYLQNIKLFIDHNRTMFLPSDLTKINNKINFLENNLADTDIETIHSAFENAESGLLVKYISRLQEDLPDFLCG